MGAALATLNHWRQTAFVVIYFVVVPLAIIGLTIYVLHTNSAQNRKNQRQICAVERYIATRYRIDRKITSIPASIHRERLAAIRRLEREAGPRCGIDAILNAP